ncbi:hypothetical protein EYF80_006597 [Liparis tanakae]|uniref:Uncharacterized protein n=1 Tax=Liparis tanakae TaxID=230148 RepID=A0A4Z2IYC7_9TELE|nr:hypothetical protein EYF80_006597 [Liparis tanakae]
MLDQNRLTEPDGGGLAPHVFAVNEQKKRRFCSCFLLLLERLKTFTCGSVLPLLSSSPIGRRAHET